MQSFELKTETMKQKIVDIILSHSHILHEAETISGEFYPAEYVIDTEKINEIAEKIIKLLKK